MLSQSESVVVDFFAKPATIFANFVLDFGKLRLGFLSYLYHIELSWNVTFSNARNFFTRRQFTNNRTGNGGGFVLVESQLPGGFSSWRKTANVSIQFGFFRCVSAV